MKTYKIGVGNLVSFLYASGDLSSETFQNVSLLEGTRAHQHLQNQYLSSDQAEVPIQLSYETNSFHILLLGRIDGILVRDGYTILEEIKSTRYPIYSPEFKLNYEHLAQLKMYAYMYMKVHSISEIEGRVTYLQIGDHQVRYFEYLFHLDELENYFLDSIESYLLWLEILGAHEQLKMESLSTLVFPFDMYRRGQREMMSAVYQTMIDNDILYAIAPTGIGKTMATLFSSLKSLRDDTQKIFYLTAKTAGRKIALDTLDMLHEGTLETKSIEITAKDSICFLEKRECDPKICPYAKGFFDRLQEATKDIFQNEKLMSRSVIERYARKHIVCPFEFSLYVSYYADVIICDYNYVFDPITHLIRYFDEDNYKPLVLIDESHNLINRSREMFSSTLIMSDFIKLRRAGSKLKPTIRTGIKHVLDQFENYNSRFIDQLFISDKSLNNDFLESIRYLMKKIENAIKENPYYPKKTEVLEGYFSMLRFIKINEYYNESYLTNAEKIDNDISIKIQCLDASKFILDIVKNKTYGTVFFSATLYPIKYYQELLTQNQGETLKIQSPFDKNRLKIIVMDQISTRYVDRFSSIDNVVDIIVSTINSKKGNYIVFFPSYQYLNQILDQLPNSLDADILIQKKDMDLKLRDLMIERFKTINDCSQLAFFVMGGMFAEGIDYIGDMLNGVIIVGVGLPMINETNNQLRDYYQLTFKKGFDYAYLYPGMNKVIQAVGRVIRTSSDFGIAILIDDRFNSYSYRKLFPPEWKNYEVIRSKQKLEQSLGIFWNKMSNQ
ncbi:MAG: PD-(D/E)XK nuclease family protein [Acholeplasmataceae bacterium]|nr:PD-(D/E)XK nuclease family protein [Acholeplasmataceae bacterium]